MASGKPPIWSINEKSFCLRCEYHSNHFLWRPKILAQHVAQIMVWFCNTDMYQHTNLEQDQYTPTHKYKPIVRMCISFWSFPMKAKNFSATSSSNQGLYFVILIYTSVSILNWTSMHRHIGTNLYTPIGSMCWNQTSFKNLGSNTVIQVYWSADY